MATKIEIIRAALHIESGHVQDIANRAYAAAHDRDSTDSDRTTMELVGNRATDLVIAISRLR